MTDDNAVSCRDRKRKDKSKTMNVLVDPTDILLGRGKSYKNHPGNIEFQVIINENRARYFEAKTHREKREITVGIVESICENRRFLKFDKQSWKEAAFETARQKVAHALQYRQRCSLNSLSHSTNESDDTFGSGKIEPQMLGEIDDNTYASAGPAAEWPFREHDALPSCHVGSSRSVLNYTTTIEDYTTKLRKMSDVIGIQTSKPSFDLQHCSACKATIAGVYINCLCSQGLDLLLLPSQIERPRHTMTVNNETQLLKSSDDHLLNVQISPPPVNSLLRGTSDFSFSDFSLYGEMVPNDDNYADEFENC